jgi:hypothetical protein
MSPRPTRSKFNVKTYPSEPGYILHNQPTTLSKPDQDLDGYSAHKTRNCINCGKTKAKVLEENQADMNKRMTS